MEGRPQYAHRRRFSELLLRWYSTNKRDFPWRATKSAYKIAVAEVLLQKTCARNALPVYEEMVHRYPTARKLAEAESAHLAQILLPLGLPRRASLLHGMARKVVEKHAGCFPRTEPELRALPGIGPYGAGAIASQAFNLRAPMIDINVMRILSRVFSMPFKPRNGPTATQRQTVLDLMSGMSPRQFNLALLDFGALVCTARRPGCESCQLSRLCESPAC